MSSDTGILDRLRFRDGASQQQRDARALDPDSFALDERSLRDLLEFARQYAGTLLYYNSNNEAAGDWSAFLDGNPDEMIAFLQSPAALDHDPNKKARYAQPHLALFLTFLALLQRAQVQMNGITRRQLDFYYQQALGFQQKTGAADHVHILAELEEETEEVLIPRGTQLYAGEDAAGEAILYQTEEHLLANQARISQLMTLHVDKEVIDVAGIREQETSKDPVQLRNTFWETLKLVYREPGTENTPRKFLFDNVRKIWSDNFEIFDTGTEELDTGSVEVLDKLYDLITGENGLHIRISAFQRVVELFEAWRNPLNWRRAQNQSPVQPGGGVKPFFKGGINDYLRKAGRLPADFNFADYLDFHQNLKIALGIDVDGRPQKVDNSGALVADSSKENIFKNLDDVNNLYDLYFRYLIQKKTGDGTIDDNVSEAIAALHFVDDAYGSAEKHKDFEQMMKLRMSTLEYIKEILHILGTAGKRGGSSDLLDAGTVKELHDLDVPGNLHLFYSKGRTLASFINYLCNPENSNLLKNNMTNNADDIFRYYFFFLSDLETYFKMPMEDYYFIRNLYKPDQQGNWSAKTPVWKWRRADELLQKAHRDLSGPPAIPEIIRWRDFYVARDATMVEVPGFNTGDNLPRWKTFGKLPNPRIPTDVKYLEAGALGFVFATPALSLQEGIRTLTLDLSFQERGFELDKIKAFIKDWAGKKAKVVDVNQPAIDLTHTILRPFSIEISTGKKWIPAPEWTEFTLNTITKTIHIKFVLNEETAPLAPVDDPAYPAAWPALKLMLNREEVTLPTGAKGTTLPFYTLFRTLLLREVKLSIAVKGLSGIQVQNQLGSIDLNSPFEPFGPAPQVGSRFYIAHPELAAQRLDALTLHLDWNNAQNLETYYAPYKALGKALKIPGLDTAAFPFKIGVSLREAHRGLDLPLFAIDVSGNPTDAEGVPLPVGTSPTAEHPFALSGKSPDHLKWTAGKGKDAPVFSPNQVPYVQRPLPNMADDILQSDRYVQVSLHAPDLLHRRYASLLGMAGANGAIVTEVLKVKDQKSIQLRGLPATGLAAAAFTVTNALNNTILDVSKYNETDKQLTLLNNATDDPPVEVSYRTLHLPEPYTPVLNGLTVDYETSVTAKFTEWKETRNAKSSISAAFLKEATADPVTSNGPVQLLHLQPFGVNDLTKNGQWVITGTQELKDDKGEVTGKNITEQLFFRFLPNFEDEGQLFLGIEDLRPPQNLTLLFQLAEGSSNPDFPPARVEWAYLSGHRWTALGNARILSDSTNGLLNSGIMRLAIPADASLQHSLMPAGLHWLRATVGRHSESLGDTIAIHTQALRAVRLDQGPDADHYGATLPAQTITEPYEPIPGLLHFEQPYSSFGGKPAEQAPAFYRRVSERLRHKNRALTIWDYERLVLEQFPEIYKVKALATDMLDAGAPPGAVTVVVIPDIRSRRPFDPFEPKVSQTQLMDIQAFLQRAAPPFVRVQVQNPRFHYLKVRVAVRFGDMNNFGFYADRLEREIKQFLSPWAFDEAGEITFGRNVSLSVLVHFIENRQYVDYIDPPTLFLRERQASDGSFNTLQIGGTIQLQGPDIIFVSEPEHLIEPLDDTIDPRERNRSGIGYAMIDLDFQVKPQSPSSGI